MALKDRLEARRQGFDGAGDGQLTVLEGVRGAPPVAPQQPGALDDQAQKSTRTPLAFAAGPDRVTRPAPQPDRPGDRRWTAPRRSC